jgi:hypothetical protein
MVCGNLCERLYSKIIVGTSKNGGAKKYCGRCEIYFLHDGLFCPCCGMKLELSATGKKDRERLRQIRSLEQLTEIHWTKQRRCYFQTTYVTYYHQQSYTTFLASF